MGRKKRGECAYCGQFGTITRDHVVSQCLFDVLPTDNSVIVVPSCRFCQEEKGKDEAYFAHRMVADHRVSSHPVARTLAYNEMMRAIQTRRSDVAADFMRTREMIHLETSSGIYLGPHHRGIVKKQRLVNVARYMVCGLYYHMMGQRLPKGYSAHASEDSADSPPLLLTRETVHLIHEYKTYEKHMGDVFSAYGAPSVDDPGFSLWLMVLYGKIGYLGMTTRDVVVSS